MPTQRPVASGPAIVCATTNVFAPKIPPENPANAHRDFRPDAGRKSAPDQAHTGPDGERRFSHNHLCDAPPRISKSDIAPHAIAETPASKKVIPPIAAICGSGQ